jgi:hypothetical protein
VQAAVCHACADHTNHAPEDQEPPDAMKPMCVECAKVENIPVVAKMDDGFYEWKDSAWIKQSDRVS